MQAALDHSLEQVPKDIALSEPTMPVAREGRVIRHLAVEAKPAEPAIGKVEMNLLAQPPLRPDAHAVAHDQHPHHQLRINRRPADGAVERLQCEVSLFGKQRKLGGVARMLAVPPERALYVGDETRDVQAAKAAGFDSAAVSWGYSTRSALAAVRPTYLVDSLQELAVAIADQPILRLVQ